MNTTSAVPVSSSEKQRTANHSNAKKSTGPKTQAGKAKEIRRPHKQSVFEFKTEED